MLSYRPPGAQRYVRFDTRPKTKAFCQKFRQPGRPMARPTAWQAATGKHAERARGRNTIGKRSVPGDGRQTGNPKSPVDARETNLRRTTALYGRKVIFVRRIRIARKPLPAYRRSIQRMKAQPPRIWSDMPGSPIRKSCKAARSDPVIAHSPRVRSPDNRAPQPQAAAATRDGNAQQSVPRRRPAATI